MPFIAFARARHLLPNIVVACIMVMTMAALPTAAQTTQPVTDSNPLEAIGALRAALVEAFNKGDIDGLLAHIDPEAVVTWQNGEVCHGPSAVRAYYDKMIASPNHIVSRLSVNPEVDDRHVYGTWAVSSGNLHDEYWLTDGSNFRFDSRFTATIAKRGDVWKVSSFHASVNAFNNPILKIAAKKSGTWGAAIGAVAGLVVGIIGVSLLKRRKARSV